MGVWDTLDSGGYEGYIGVRVDSDESTSFGWLRLSTDVNSYYPNNYAFTLYEYAITESGCCNITVGSIT